MWEDDEIVERFDSPQAPSLPELKPGLDSQRAASLVLWLVGFLLSLQARYYIPDAAIAMLFKFLSVFFGVIAKFSPFIATLASMFPKSTHIALQSLQYDNSFTKFVTCPKCWKLYLFQECFEKSGSKEISKCCSCIEYPNHPQPSRRAPCGVSLLKTVEFLSGREVLYPHKVFCYKSLKSCLQELLLRPDFVQDCEQWRNRNVCNDELRDIYDGRIWKMLQSVLGSPFLSVPFTYGLILNVDWFQPYTHTVASVGVIYLCIMNLPRHKRYKRKNVLLIGIIPGPSEPSHDSLLQPLVSELKDFLHGIPLRVRTTVGFSEEAVRCALLCVACDLPAGRKVCGFLSHSAARGCSKCMKIFPGVVGSMCYSGFDRTIWPPRTNDTHRRNVKEIMKCNTKTARAKMESELGCRYSVLLELPYFDAPQMLAIDPMHNLFLGIGKHMIRIWIKNGLLDSSKFEQIQQFVDSTTVPCDVGRIPRKIATGFSGFKADQYKVWIMIYSIPVLFGHLPTEHLECWRHFVLACRILCQHSLSSVQINLLDALLMQFCKRVEHIYGKESISPNMHLLGHLREVLLDYGPVHEFWLFIFERYNGVLGKQPTNNRAIESQFVNRFLRDNMASSFSYPEDFKEDFQQICDDASVNRRPVGSVLDTLTSNGFQLPRKASRGVLTTDEVNVIEQLYTKLTVDQESLFVVNSVYLKYSSITINGRQFGSSGKRTTTSVVAQASWDEKLYGNPATPLPDSLAANNTLRPVNICHFMKVSVTVNMESTLSFLFAYVAWFQQHPDRYAFGKPVELWCPTLFEPFGLHSFVPLDHLHCRCAHGVMKYHDEPLLFVVPLVE